jgi:hypothetical protein
MIMKTSFNNILIAFLSVFIFSISYSQLNYSTSFDGCNATTCSGWTLTGGTSPNITSTAATGYSPCNSASAKSNIWSANTTTTLTSGSLGVSNGTAVTFSFKGKAITYSSGNAEVAGACTFTGFWSTDGTTWTSLNSINNSASTNCNTYTFNAFTPSCNSPVYVRIVATRNSGDFWAVMDDISVTQTPIGPSGTITKTCVGDFSTYDLLVNVTNLDGASGVNISIGATTYHAHVGIGSYSITGLSGNNVVNVQDVGNSCRGFSQSFSACNVCSDAPALPSDECASAPLIDLSQPFVGSTNCSYSPSVGSPGGCGSIENDSWMTFIAGSSDVEIEFTVGDCSNGNGIQLSVFSGTCGSLSLIAGSCVNPTGENTTGTWNFSGLTIGASYYIRIDGYANDLCDYYFNPISGVVITPDNDECPSAHTLTCGDSHISNNILATNTGAPSACAGGGSNPTGKGVWYTFVGTGDEMIISTYNPGTNFNTRINVYSATTLPYCSNLICQGGADSTGNGDELSFVSVLGRNYYVYVSGVGTAEGQFEIDLECVPIPPCNANAGTWD